MNKLINELQHDHQEITGLLDNIYKVGLTSDEGIALLMQSRTDLLAHLAKEEEELCPPLLKQAQSDTSLKSSLELFGGDIKKVRDFTLHYYSKYSVKNSRNHPNFIKDSVELIVSLRDRILREDVFLHKAYERVIRD